MSDGGGSSGGSVVCDILGVYSVSVCKKSNFFSFLMGWWVSQRYLQGGCVLEGFEVGHQGKEFNKSCRKRSGSGISERRPTTSKNSDKDSAGMSSSWKALRTRSEAS